MQRLNAITKKRAKSLSKDLFVVEVESGQQEALALSEALIDENALNEVELIFQQFVQRMQHGVEEISKALAFVPDYSILRESFEETTALCLHAISEQKEIEKQVLDCLNNGMPSLQQTYEISNETMSYLYQAAKRLLDKKYYIEAAAAFAFLSLFSPTVCDFWTSLGTASSKLHREEEAILSFSLAALANPNTPWPHLYSADCYKTLKNYEMALECTDLALKVAKEQPEFQSLMNDIAAVKEQIRVKASE
jgi:type III secretion system low calcium response chaperone LcrH/SycD